MGFTLDGTSPIVPVGNTCGISLLKDLGWVPNFASRGVDVGKLRIARGVELGIEMERSILEGFLVIIRNSVSVLPQSTRREF